MPTHVPAEAHGDERGALLGFLEAQRGGLRRAVLGLTEEQALQRPSASELSLFGLLKHAAEVEQGWILLAQERPLPRRPEDFHLSFVQEDGETLAGVLELWEQKAKETDEFVRALPSLEETFPLPEAPWFPPNARHSMRWLVLHLIEETARHAGHADVIRESLDGKTAFELVDEEQKAG